MSGGGLFLCGLWLNALIDCLRCCIDYRVVIVLVSTRIWGTGSEWQIARSSYHAVTVRKHSAHGQVT